MGLKKKTCAQGSLKSEVNLLLLILTYQTGRLVKEHVYEDDLASRIVSFMWSLWRLKQPNVKSFLQKIRIFCFYMKSSKQLQYVYYIRVEWYFFP